MVESNTFFPTRCKETCSFFRHLENEYRCPCHPQQQSSAFTAFSTLSLLSVPFFKKIIHPPQQQFTSFDFCQASQGNGSTEVQTYTSSTVPQPRPCFLALPSILLIVLMFSHSHFLLSPNSQSFRPLLCLPMHPSSCCDLCTLTLPSSSGLVLFCSCASSHTWVCHSAS